MPTNLSKLRWKCRRGMRELDVVLVEYLENHYSKSNEKQQKAFNALLQLEDPQLFTLLMGNNQCVNSDHQDLVDRLKNQFLIKK